QGRRRAGELHDAAHGTAVLHRDRLVGGGRHCEREHGQPRRRERPRNPHGSRLISHSSASQKLRLYRKNHSGNTITRGSTSASSHAVESVVRPQSRKNRPSARTAVTP